MLQIKMITFNEHKQFQMKSFKTLFFFLITATLATVICSFSINDDGKKKKEDEDPSTFYYLGEIKTMTPDSIPLGTFVALTKQIVNKKENLITMQSVSIDQKGETKEYHYTINVNDPLYVIRDVDSTYSGTGRYHGKAWKWSHWDYSIQYKNPVGRMVGKDFVSLWGLMVNKDFYGPDGKKLIHYHERHKFITKEQFEILYLQVLKCSTK